MKNDRLFQIIYRLLEKQNITAPELADELEVSVRTIYRDIDTLSAAGIPVYAVSGKNGGIALLPGYTLDRSLLSDKEQDEILFALQSMQATSQKEDLLLSKLGTVFQKTNRNWIEVDFSRWGHKKTDTLKFDLIKQAILEKRILQLSYFGSRGEKSRRKVKPIRLVFKATNWYMQAYCLKAQDYRTFKINRIHSMELTTEVFEEEFCEVPVMDEEYDSMGNVMNVVLRFSPNVTYRVCDEFDYDMIERQSDGSYIATMTVPEDGWIYSYLLSFGVDVEIIEPIALKENLLVYLEKMEKHFKS